MIPNPYPEAMRVSRALVVLTILLPAACCLLPAAYASRAVSPSEGELPPIPDRFGLGGAFSGSSNGALIVAGGTSVPNVVQGEAQEKWHDGIFVLEAGKKEWQTGFRLPRPLAYGTSITTPVGLICVGGSDAGRAYRSVLLLEWVDGKIKITRLPDLPQPRGGAAGALLGNAIYVAAGRTGSEGSEVTATFWKLALPKKGKGHKVPWDKSKWQTLKTWPGPPRWGAMAAAQEGKLYLFGGWNLTTEADGPPKCEQLNDAYCYDPGTQAWKRIAEVPCRTVAAAPLLACGESHILVFGGHDQAAPSRQQAAGGRQQAANPQSTIHNPQSLSREILAYHTITDTWVGMGTVPVGLVATNAVRWQNQIVIPGGQLGPRTRSNRVYPVQLPRRKPDFGFLNSTVLGLYLLALVAMGVYFSRREKSTADFFIGGRRIPWWAAGLSIFGTQLSSISFMTIPAKVYDTDWVYFAAVVCIVAIQPIVVFFYLPFFRRLNVTSAYEYLEKRFNVLVRLFGSASFILFQTGRMTIVLFLPALALAAVTGINIYVCIVVMGVLATLYTALGGIEAVVWTDVLQVFVLVGGALMSMVIIFCSVDGGLGAIVEIGQADGKFNLANWGWDYAAPVFWVIVTGGLFQSMVSYSADQAVIQRYLTTRDEKSAARAIWTNAALVIPVSAIWFVLGTSLYAFYKTHPALLDPALKTDQTFPLFIAGQLPAGIVGLVIAGLFAASMSTLDSSLNSISTAIVTDFYRRFKPAADDHVCLNLARSLTVILGVVGTGTALWMAMNQDKVRSLWDMYMAVLGLLMGSLTGLFALGVFTRRTHARGALIGAFGGALVLFLVQRYTRTHFFLYAGVGITACCGIGYLASLLVPGRAKSLDGLTVYTQQPRNT